jgi:hypothetical protein
MARISQMGRDKKIHGGKHVMHNAFVLIRRVAAINSTYYGH